ncbi:MAG: ABC transporter ATP-binding protein [Phycisphaerales bacterium]|nr:MAG: ABC transporter ATP-binding protein [Phycisphaerales bacterium]
MDILEINDIRKEFGTVVAVNEVSFSLERGHVLGLIGPNGAGKTTLLRILATVLRPTSGSVQVMGCDSAKEYLDIRKHVGFLPDFFNLYNDLTLRECLDFFARAYRVQKALISGRVAEVLKYIELEDKRNDLIRHLSRGMVQRMGIGVLLVHDPDVFLLDEPASGLDPKARIQLRAVLKKLSGEGKTIIISSHILTELSGFCSHIALMDKGKIVLHGAVDEIQQDVFGSRRICIAVLDNRDEAVRLIGEFPNADVEQVRDNQIIVQMAAGEAELARLNAHLVAKGVKVFGFSEQKTDLEDLFMRISGGEAQHALGQAQ